MNLYVDLQVNGYGGVDFNQDQLIAEDLHRACQKLSADGVGSILATLITEDVEILCQRVRTLVNLREQDPLVKQIVAGIHLEGPFISPEPGYRGAHPLDAIRVANPDTMRRLLDAGNGLVRLVTLAPECDPHCAVTQLLVWQGITVSAGHTDASLEQLRAAIDHGLSMFTHLGNGCPAQLPRHDNIIQRALNLREHLWLCFIADGVHIPFFALKNYVQLAGAKHCIIVTDAIAPAGLGIETHSPGNYTLGRWQLSIGADKVARAPDGSHFVGAVVTMKQSHDHLCQQLGLSSQECELMLSQNSTRAISGARVSS